MYTEKVYRQLYLWYDNAWWILTSLRIGFISISDNTTISVVKYMYCGTRISAHLRISHYWCCPPCCHSYCHYHPTEIRSCYHYSPPPTLLPLLFLISMYLDLVEGNITPTTARSTPPSLPVWWGTSLSPAHLSVLRRGFSWDFFGSFGVFLLWSSPIWLNLLRESGLHSQ